MKTRFWTARPWLRMGLALGAVAGIIALTPLVHHATEPENEADQQDAKGFAAAPYENGTLMVVGGGHLPDSLFRRFMSMAGGEDARIVVITTASVYAGDPDMEERFGPFKELPSKSLIYLHTRSREEADAPEFSDCLLNATAVWIAGGNQNWLSDAYLGTLVEKRLHDLLKRGGLIGGTSAGAAIQSRVMIGGGSGNTPKLTTGLGFLPGTIVDQHFDQRGRLVRLQAAIDQNPHLVGVGIDERTAIIVKRRSKAHWFEVAGEGEATVYLAGGSGAPPRVRVLGVGAKANLALLKRDAIRRSESPEIQLAAPRVSEGTLVLVGNGVKPKEYATEFLKAAGGPASPIVILTSHSPKTPSWMEGSAFENVQHIVARQASDLEQEVSVKKLSEARGVWLEEADEILANLSSTSKGARLLHKVLLRGGTIGGNAESLSRHGEFRSPTTIDEQISWQKGLGFLVGTTVCNWKGNLESMAPLAKSMNRKGQGGAPVMGLGVQDGSAAVVKGSVVHVLGDNPLVVIAPEEETKNEEAMFEVIKTGEFFDLKTRRRVPKSELLGAGDQESPFSFPAE